ncbi:hypothetical protein [Marinigracilibium pacificum]|uniref:Uncharacterized protein n=1 Tax=Marinigracilibium pacificum TaxID=2729599 RepID=A0A848J6S0_9BACT|nr:hypothetical protein [Marinigracilibium pacificum]NMM48812.1 hypothetical protein [Marinigracilibium pacificum]
MPTNHHTNNIKVTTLSESFSQEDLYREINKSQYDNALLLGLPSMLLHYPSILMTKDVINVFDNTSVENYNQFCSLLEDLESIGYRNLFGGEMHDSDELIAYDYSCSIMYTLWAYDNKIIDERENKILACDYGYKIRQVYKSTQKFIDQFFLVAYIAGFSKELIAIQKNKLMNKQNGMLKDFNLKKIKFSQVLS